MADEAFEAYREFTGQLILRFERAVREITAQLRECYERHDAQLEASREENRRYFTQLDAKLDDQLAESRAQREALFRMLDKLDGGGAAPATG